MLLSVKDVKKTYHLGDVLVEALRGISIDIAEGEFVSVCGPSGSGKSTFLNLIGTIDTPTSGQVVYNGQDVSLMSDRKRTAMRNSTIGFVFQSFNLIPVFTALENVMLPLTFGKSSKKEARDKAMEMLSAVGLEKFVQHKPNKLSGGQRQRVAIARALAQQPSIIIADEPTANLDSVTSFQIIKIMQELNEKDDITFIFSTHDPRLIKEVKRVVWLEDGHIVKKEKGDLS